MTDSSGALRAAEDACATMQAALAALKDSRDASCPVPTRQQVQAAVHLLKMEVSKTGLLYSQHSSSSSSSSGPTLVEVEALLKGFQQAACTLCMLYTGIAANNGGPTLRQSLHQTATTVVEACCSLIRGAVAGGAGEAQLMILSGFALEMLDAAAKAPLDSRTAIGRAITQVLKQLADAQKELEDTIQSAAAEADAAGDDAAAANGSAGDGQHASEAQVADDDSDAGFGFAEEALNAGQLAVAHRVRRMLAAVVGLVKVVVRQLLAEREGLDADGVEAWESMLYHIKTLSPLCDDLSAAVYPPQDAEELSATAESLVNSCELLLEECPEPSAGSQAGQVAAGAAAGADGQAAQQQEEQKGGVAALQAALHEVEQAHAELAKQLEAGSEEPAE